MHAESLPQEEIGLRLFEIPAFQEFTREIGERVVEGMRGAVLLGQYRNEARGWALAKCIGSPKAWYQGFRIGKVVAGGLNDFVHRV